jgi:small conductance mechanosensitive channel
VTHRTRIKTRPGEQWVIGREYRRRLKCEFERAGIEFPYPQREVHIHGEAAPRAA